MESITALVACAAAFSLSYYIGYHIATNTTVAAMMGGASGLVFAVIFFIFTVGIGMLVPDTFEPRQLGIHFLVLLPLTPIASAIVAVLAHRHLERLEARRLPF
jgi:hypothetical protein